MVETLDMLGPLGGTIALSWAAGAASGYIFAVKLMSSKIKFLEEQIEISEKKCEARIRSTTEQLQRQIDFIKEILENELKASRGKSIFGDG